MRIGWLLFLCLGLPLQAAQSIYRWVDEQGVVHYSDRPHPGRPTEVLNFPDPIPPASTVPQPAGPEEPPQLETSTSYRIQLITPHHQETLRSNTGIIQLQAQVSPALPDPGYQLLVLMDGQPAATVSNTLALELQNVDRGEHSLQVRLLSEDGKLLAGSPPVTIYLHRASLLISPKSP